MSLLQSPSMKVIHQSLQQTFLPEESYVLSLTSLDNYYAASASSPSNQIHLFDKASLRNVGVLRGHENATTYLRTIHALGASNRDMLLTSGKDGCVMAWDVRSGTTSLKMETSGRPRPLLCCDASSDGLMVAAGTDLLKEDVFILYWDPRNPVAPLRTHGSTHSDDITAGCGKVLLSTSSDGLICTSDALEEDEDEAGGWIHDARGTRVWAASDMETFSYWLILVARLYTDHGTTWVTDYLITGQCTQKVEGGLGVFVGSNDDLSNPTAPWTIHSMWAGGHRGVVRSLYWDDEHGVLVTGGEDSKINTWRIHDPIDSGAQMDEQIDDQQTIRILKLEAGVG
ncbi:WD40 repeat-like protein [Melanogaster broomeanus]|nr:WD40 repeat-like protein [Melanogaster broomeanus]